MNLEERIGLAASHVRSRTLTQGYWRKKDVLDRELVCLLAAFGDDINDPANCPVELMPEWLARLLPLINDGMPAIFFYDFAAKFVTGAPCWSNFDAAEWTRIRKALLMEIVWYTNALVAEGDQEAGHVFRDHQAARQRFDALLTAARAVTPALFDGARLAAAGERARERFNAEQRLHVGLVGRERRVVIAAQHAAHAAYRAAEGSAADAACYMAKCAQLVDVDRHQSAAWRHVATVLLRLLDKEVGQ